MGCGLSLRFPRVGYFPGVVAAVVSTAELENRRLAQAPLQPYSYLSALTGSSRAAK